MYSHASIGSGSELGDFVTLAQGVYVGEDVRVGACTFIGCGAILAPRNGKPLSIGENVYVHAGTVVSEDLPDGAVVAGDPMFDPRLAERRKRPH